MVMLIVPSSLATLLSEAAPEARRRAVELDARDWEGFLAQIRRDHPSLAEKVLSQDGVATGFVLAINNEVRRHVPSDLELRAGDEICVLPAVAGG